MSTLISVVVPIYRCTDCLVPLCERLSVALSRLTQDWEIVLVDDGDATGAWSVISDIAKSERRVRGLRLSRNFGQHPAIMAGLAESRGDWAVVMDGDLQDPPEEIPKLFALAQNGNDVVFAMKKNRSGSLWRGWMSGLYVWFLRILTGRDIPREQSNFSIISKKVVNEVIRLKDKRRNYMLVLYWLGFTTARMHYIQQDRGAGKSSYTLRALISHAMAGILFETTHFIRWIVYLGVITSSLGMVLAVYLVYRRLVGPVAPGWTSVIVMQLISSGIILMSLGATGTYVSEIFEQTKDRPYYVIDKRIN